MRRALDGARHALAALVGRSPREALVGPPLPRTSDRLAALADVRPDVRAALSAVDQAALAELWAEAAGLREAEARLVALAALAPRDDRLYREALSVALSAVRSAPTLEAVS